MREVAHLVAGPLDDLGVRAQQLIDLFGQRRDLARIIAGDAFGLALAHLLDRLAQSVDRSQRQPRDDAAHDRQRDAHSAEHDQRLAAELADQVEALVEVAGDDDVQRPAVAGDQPLDGRGCGCRNRRCSTPDR